MQHCKITSSMLICRLFYHVWNFFPIIFFVIENSYLHVDLNLSWRRWETPEQETFKSCSLLKDHYWPYYAHCHNMTFIVYSTKPHQRITQKLRIIPLVRFIDKTNERTEQLKTCQVTGWVGKGQHWLDEANTTQSQSLAVFELTPGSSQLFVFVFFQAFCFFQFFCFLTQRLCGHNV